MSTPARTAVAVSGEPGTAALMHEVLAALRFDVVEVQRGEQVLDALRIEAPDLVVFDGDLPEMSALAFLRLARPLLGSRKVPVILARDGGAALAATEGSELVEVVLDRPISAPDLREAVTIALWASDRDHEARISGAHLRSGGYGQLSGAQRQSTGTPASPAAPPKDDTVRDLKLPAGGPQDAARPAKTRGAVQRRSGAQSAKIRAPGAARRFKRTLAFQPGQQPTVETGPIPTPVDTPPSRKRANVPSDTQRQMPRLSNRPTASGGVAPAAAPRRDISGDVTQVSGRRRKTEPRAPTTSPDAPQQGSAPAVGEGTPDAAPEASGPTAAPPIAAETAAPTQQRKRRRSRNGPKRRPNRPTVVASPKRRSKGLGVGEGTLIADRYVVRDLLGSGGMAEVYRVHDRELEEDVALKLLKENRTDPETQQRFRQEMRICRRLNHPSIVRTFEFGVFEGRRFLTMEVLEGEDMARLIGRRRGPMSEDMALRLFRQVCQGLDAAHHLGVIHRDVKPHNIFVVDGGQHARLMDFGIAKFQDFTTTAEAGLAVLGTPAYLAPERLQDGTEITAQADLYSVGASMYHVLTNKLPFDGPNISSLLTSILMKPPLPPRSHNPDISPAVEDVILATMDKDPARRPASCADLAAELAALASRGR